ncbi:hypothetical protein ACWXVL_02200 [Mycoplasma sp. 128]
MKLLKILRFKKNISRVKNHSECKRLLYDNINLITFVYTNTRRNKPQFKNAFYALFEVVLLATFISVIALPFFSIYNLAVKQEPNKMYYLWIFVAASILAFVSLLIVKIIQIIFINHMHKLSEIIRTFLKNEKLDNNENVILNQIVNERLNVFKLDFAPYAKHFNLNKLDKFLEMVEDTLEVATKDKRKNISTWVLEKLSILAIYCLALFLLLDFLIELQLKLSNNHQEISSGGFVSLVSSPLVLIIFLVTHHSKVKVTKKIFKVAIGALVAKQSDIYLNLQVEKTLEKIKYYRYLLEKNEFKQKYIFMILQQINIFANKDVVHGMNKNYSYIKIDIISQNLMAIQSFLEKTQQ